MTKSNQPKPLYADSDINEQLIELKKNIHRATGKASALQDRMKELTILIDNKKTPKDRRTLARHILEKVTAEQAAVVALSFEFEGRMSELSTLLKFQAESLAELTNNNRTVID